jgi:hypothetical protein
MITARLAGIVRPGYGDAGENNSPRCRMHRHSCLAKEDPDNGASILPMKGLVA